MKHIIIITAATGLVMAGCTTTGNVEKKAAIGGAAGAVTGAIIGNNVGDGDAKTGAVIGGLIGAAGGGYVGHTQDQRDGQETEFRQRAEGQPLIFDESANRYFFVDRSTGRTYWQNGSLRSYG